MRFQTELIPATLLRRYKRFLSDVRLPDGREVVAHCPNPGAMTGLAEPGMRVWLEPNDDPRKKLKFGWRLCETQAGYVCIDTGIANKVVARALAGRAIPPLAGYKNIQAEVPYADKSRIDFLLTDGGPDLYLEVKSVTLSRRSGLAEFPDAPTARGAKHMGALAQMVRAGCRGVIFYVIMRSDCHAFDIAADIDPAYASAYHGASGVETMCYMVDISPQDIRLGAYISKL